MSLINLEAARISPSKIRFAKPAAMMDAKYNKSLNKSQEIF
jgi:hypothetical protein